MSDSRFGLKLEVIGRQIVVKWPHALLKKFPGLPRQLMQVFAVLGAKHLSALRSGWLAGPPCDQG